MSQSSPAVLYLQRALNAKGAALIEDGIWGDRTRRALDAALSASAEAPEIDPRALSLIKEFEGFRADAYRDPVGIWTIGYGTTAAAGVGIEPKLGMRITEPEAEVYLRRALDKFAAEIRPAITAPVSPAEFGAFLSLAYNIGPAGFKGSTVLRRFNQGDKAGAADAFLMWVKAGGRELPGLVRRRKAERDLFLSA